MRPLLALCLLALPAVAGPKTVTTYQYPDGRRVTVVAEVLDRGPVVEVREFRLVQPTAAPVIVYGPPPRTVGACQQAPQQRNAPTPIRNGIRRFFGGQ